MVRGQREEIKNGPTGIRGLETRVGRECSTSRGGQIPQRRYICRRSPRRESQCCSRGTAPRALN